MFKDIKYTLLVLPIIVFTAGCSGTKVISDYDKTEDFTQFKTYEYLGWANNSDQVLTRFDKERIESAFASEGKKRGLIGGDASSDVIVSLYITGEVKTQKTAHTTTTGMGMGMGARGMRSPGWGWGGGMGMAQSTTTYNETQYMEGTLMIEMFDRIDEKLIWQAIGTKRVAEDPKKREKDIPKKVAAIMKAYPVSAEK